MRCLIQNTTFDISSFCIISMFCWGSWANTKKLVKQSWDFQLFYWDYILGIVLVSLALAVSMGSFGLEGRSFFNDLLHAHNRSLFFAFCGGIIFNIANTLLVIAIDMAGMAVAFPISIGIALIIGITINYIGMPAGNTLLLFIGALSIIVAILIDAIAYKISRNNLIDISNSKKSIMISIAAGLFMSTFYWFVVKSMSSSLSQPSVGLLTPYTAMFIFSIGIFTSNFIINMCMIKSNTLGKKVNIAHYFSAGNWWNHSIGLLGGIIWGVGTLFNFLASGLAGPAISYGLGQGATMIAALWGIFIWKEFLHSPRLTKWLLFFMVIFYLFGLILIVISR